MAATDQERKFAEDVHNMTDLDLLSLREEHVNNPGSIYSLLIDKEFERRARLHQHDLDLKLVAEQVRWGKFSAILTATMTLLGAIVGALLTFWLQSNPLPPQSKQTTRPTQQPTAASIPGDYKEKAESVPLKTPESK